jgi:hypothetical protein
VCDHDTTLTRMKAEEKTLTRGGGSSADPGVLELDNVEGNLLFPQVFGRASRQMRMHPHKSNTSNRDKPEVLISSVPTKR